MSNKKKIVEEIMQRSGIEINEDESDLTYFESRILNMFDMFFNQLKSTFGVNDDSYGPYPSHYQNRTIDRLADLSNEDKEKLKAICMRKMAYAKKLVDKVLMPVEETDDVDIEIDVDDDEE